ncbi:hypothetical protein ACNQGC_05425, partial [Flavobacterium sp. GSP11]|uniref:hypothetical protein n=1 Tax=Flavobacterium sp. GSP11 TaxID=3401730 RepID=UPI003AB05B3A
FLIKNGGGHFAPELGGHFELESGGHFKLELGGQYNWNLHNTPCRDFIPLTKIQIFQKLEV